MKPKSPAGAGLLVDQLGVDSGLGIQFNYIFKRDTCQIS